jgi:hypothetical protein
VASDPAALAAAWRLLCSAAMHATDGAPPTAKIVRRLGESLVLLGGVLVAFGLWVGGEGGSITRFVLWLCATSGLLFASWGLLLRAHRQAAGCFAAAILATASQALMVALIVSTGFEALWLPWVLLDALAMAIGFGLGLRHRRRRP